MSAPTRKNFLRSLGTGALGLFAAKNLPAAVASHVPTLAATRATLPVIPPLPAFDAAAPEPFWRAVRAQYPMTPERVYFNAGGLGPAPARVLELLAFVSHQLQQRVETGHDLFAEARAIAADFLGARAPSEICFARNATEGNSIVSSGLALRPGDEVIFESHAHPGGYFPWLNRQRYDGIVVRTFEPDPTGAQGNLDRIAALLTPRTRVIQVSHVVATTGLVLPVAEIARLARSRGLWFHVDGAQSAGMIPVNLPALGCDSYATSGHKWLGAPHETGLLWIRRDRVEEIIPRHVGAYSSGDINLALPVAPIAYVEGAKRFEYGTRNAAAAAALVEAMRFQNELGRDRIAARGRFLAARLRAALEKIPGLELLSPADPALASAMTTFRSPRLDHKLMFERLLDRHHFRCRPVSECGLDGTRVSTHIFNSPAEVDRLAAAVAELHAQA